MDAWAVPGLVLWGMLALGHLLEGSDPGMPVARWGLRSSLAGYREQPVALYAAVVAAVFAVVLYGRLRRGQRTGQVAAAGLVLAGVAQFALSFVRLPYLYVLPTRWAVLDPMEWVALGMMVAGGVVAIASEWGWVGGRSCREGELGMPSKNMLPKGKRRHTVKPLYRAQRGAAQEAATLAAEREFDEPVVVQAEAVEVEEAPRAAVVREFPAIPQVAIDPYGPGAATAEHTIAVPAEADGMRLDQYLARAIPEISRSRGAAAD